MNKIWFKAKNYGWGWCPVTWQGWLVLLIWLILFIFSMNILDNDLSKNLLTIIIFTAILIYICYKKGEKPRWSWGRN